MKNIQSKNNLYRNPLFSLHQHLKFSVLILGILCITGKVQSQQTLEFNQVKFVTTQETVPANKVWKVESVLPNSSTSSDPYTIKVDEQETFVGNYIGSGNHLTNVDSIEVQLRKTSATSCTETNHFNLSVGGFENGLIFQKSASASTTKNAASLSFTTLLTLRPQSLSAIMDITEIRLYGGSSYYGWYPYELRMIVYYNDGTSKSYDYKSPTNDFCGCCLSYNYFIGSSSANMQVPVRSKDTYYSPVQFPFWLKSGQKLEVGNNVMGLSVIEFNVN